MDSSGPLHFLITAGPTREYIDPVRFITNGSTGKMGYACVEAALKRGHRVTLVSGPVHLKAADGAKVIEIETCEQMADAVFTEYPHCDCVIMTAAVGDYRPQVMQQTKIKKFANTLHLELVATTDILADLGERKSHQILIGFAVEDTNADEQARAKLARKHLDAIVLNSPVAFGADLVDAKIIFPDGAGEPMTRISKLSLARRLIELAENLAQHQHP